MKSRNIFWCFGSCFLNRFNNQLDPCRDSEKQYCTPVDMCNDVSLSSLYGLEASQFPKETTAENYRGGSAVSVRGDILWP